MAPSLRVIVIDEARRERGRTGRIEPIDAAVYPVMDRTDIADIRAIQARKEPLFDAVADRRRTGAVERIDIIVANEIVRGASCHHRLMRTAADVRGHALKLPHDRRSNVATDVDRLRLVCHDFRLQAL